MMLSKRRGLSEVIATLLLLAITATGSFFLASIMQGSGFGSVSASSAPPVSPSYSVRLVTYDTRDSSDLLGIATLDNKFDKKLCTASCSATPDNIPGDGGTDFIAFRIKNVSTSPVFVESVQVWGVTHSWDVQTKGVQFDAGTSGSEAYPASGTFSMAGADMLQRSDNKIHEDEEALIIVKLSDQIAPDIALSKPVQVLVNFGGAHSAQFVLMSGDAK